MGAFPRLSVLAFFRYSSTLNFWIFIMLWIWVAKLNNLRAFPAVQIMSEHVYYPEPQWILDRLPDSTHITQTIAGNTLVTELSQYSSELVNKRKTQISANGLIYNNLHGNRCNNFHISDILDFLWNSNVRKRPYETGLTTALKSRSIDVFNAPAHARTGRKCALWAKIALSARICSRSAKWQ